MKGQYLSPLCALLILSCAGSARAQGVPSPTTSQLPAFVTISTTGECCFDVLVRDASNQPVAGAVVGVSFSNCTSITFCPNQPPGTTVNVGAKTASAVTNGAGLAHLCVCVSTLGS